MNYSMVKESFISQHRKQLEILGNVADDMPDPGNYIEMGKSSDTPLELNKKRQELITGNIY